MNTHKENIDELLQRFLGEAEARNAAEDIAKGDEIFREYPDPKPDEETIILLKARVAAALAVNRQRAVKRIYYGAAAFAAAVIMIAFVSVQLLEHKAVEPGPVATMQAASSFSGDSELFYDNTELETLNAEVAQVSDELTMSDWGIASEMDIDLIELEMGLIDIGSDFWKG